MGVGNKCMVYCSITPAIMSGNNTALPLIDVIAVTWSLLRTRAGSPADTRALLVSKAAARDLMTTASDVC